jgi:hypothetical protein
MELPFSMRLMVSERLTASLWLGIRNRSTAG